MTTKVEVDTKIQMVETINKKIGHQVRSKIIIKVATKEVAAIEVEKG